MVTLYTRSMSFSAHAARVWPPSWYAVTFFSCSEMTFDVRRGPPTTRSTASSSASAVITSPLTRAVSSAASLSTFCRSAPDMPAVRLASDSRSASGPSGLLRAWTSRIALRPAMSGAPTGIWRSKRPGRSSAGSRMSGRFVAAMMITLERSENPSISTSSWFSVCSRSSWPPPMPAPRWRPTASISSMKMMQGLFSLAWLNRSRTRDAPTPTNISTKSEPEIV